MAAPEPLAGAPEQRAVAALRVWSAAPTWLAIPALQQRSSAGIARVQLVFVKGKKPQDAWQNSRCVAGQIPSFAQSDSAFCNVGL